MDFKNIFYISDIKYIIWCNFVCLESKLSWTVKLTNWLLVYSCRRFSTLHKKTCELDLSNFYWLFWELLGVMTSHQKTHDHFTRGKGGRSAKNHDISWHFGCTGGRVMTSHRKTHDHFTRGGPLKPAIFSFGDDVIYGRSLNKTLVSTTTFWIQNRLHFLELTNVKNKSKINA